MCTSASTGQGESSSLITLLLRSSLTSHNPTMIPSAEPEIPLKQAKDKDRMLLVGVAVAVAVAVTVTVTGETARYARFRVPEGAEG